MKIMLILFLITLVFSVTGCAATPFKTGEEVLPPFGCMRAWERDHDC